MKTYNLNVEIIYIDDQSGDNYIASITDDEYKGFVVTGKSISDALRELGVSLEAREKFLSNPFKANVYKKNATNNNEQY